MTKAGQQHSKLPTRPAVVYYNPIEQVLQHACMPGAAASRGARAAPKGRARCALQRAHPTGDQLPARAEPTALPQEYFHYKCITALEMLNPTERFVCSEFPTRVGNRGRAAPHGASRSMADLPLCACDAQIAC
jgi:hypothetical protein